MSAATSSRPLSRRHVLPLDAPAKLEGPHALVRARRPGLREIALEAQVGGAGRLVGERVAQEPIAGEPRELEESHRLREPGIDDGRVPGRRPREDTTPLRRLGAGRDPVGIRRGRLSGRASPAHADRQRGHPGAGPSHALEEVTSRHRQDVEGSSEEWSRPSGSPSMSGQFRRRKGSANPERPVRHRLRVEGNVPHAAGYVKNARSSRSVSRAAIRATTASALCSRSSSLSLAIGCSITANG